jgi:hypothetical protein
MINNELHPHAARWKAAREELAFALRCDRKILTAGIKEQLEDIPHLLIFLLLASIDPEWRSIITKNRTKGGIVDERA